MEFPIDIQLIIKEYSMPIYRKPLHYNILINIFNELPVDCKVFHILKHRLKRTDYSNNKIKLANTSYVDDIYRGW